MSKQRGQSSIETFVTDIYYRYLLQISITNIPNRPKSSKFPHYTRKYPI